MDRTPRKTDPSTLVKALPAVTVVAAVAYLAAYLVQLVATVPQIRGVLTLAPAAAAP